MPSLVAPALASGTLSALVQPRLPLSEAFSLRPWKPAGDVAAARQAFDDADIQFWHTRRLDSDTEAQEWLESWRRRWDAETDASWAIARAGDDAAVGQVGLRTIFLEGAQAQISYWVLPEARQQRLAARASEALAEWSFQQLGLQRLYLQHSVRNVASCAVATSAHFRLEGTSRRHMLHTDGWHDIHVHARVNPAS